MISARSCCWLLLPAALALGGCAAGFRSSTSAVGVSAVAAERPAADRPAANEKEARARVHVDLGEAYLEASNYGVALDEAKAALSSDPGYSPAYLLVARVYAALGDVQAARANFDEALSLSPGDPDINNAYGRYLCFQGQPQAGLERLGVALRNPYYRSPARAQVNAGLCQLQLKDDAAAEISFQRALQMDPANSQASFQLADIAFRRGNYESARSYLTNLHQTGPTSAASAWLGLRVERRLGNRDDAASYAQQLKSHFPNSPEYQLLLQGNID